MPRKRESARNAGLKKSLAAPAAFTDRAREVWDGIVNGQSPGWFIHGAEALLEAHVRTVVLLEQCYIRRDAMLLDQDADLGELRDLNEMIEKQTRLLAMTSRSLRLTQQSRVRENVPKDEGRMPWEQYPDEETA